LFHPEYRCTKHPRGESDHQGQASDALIGHCQIRPLQPENAWSERAIHLSLSVILRGVTTTCSWVRYEFCLASPTLRTVPHRLWRCSSVHHETQIDAPDYTHRAPKNHSLIDWYPYKADQADHWPEFVPVLHHRPGLVAAILRNCAPGILLALLRCIDVCHVRQKHECIDYCSDRLIEQELDQDIAFACLCCGGFARFLVADFQGDIGYVRREMVFEEGLPNNVGRVTDYAKYGKLDDWRNVE
jgi:hypothetical protein